MGKSTNLFKVALGIGGAITAVALSRKESRDKLKHCLLYTSDAADE
mgnify:CR=1 FL=1